MPNRPPRWYNSLTREIDPLTPLEPPALHVYACGPTIYAHPHIGNFRYFVWVDVLHRFLRWLGYDVTLVMNLTDVDDRIIARAGEAGVTLEELTGQFEDSFRRGLETLRIVPAAAYPRATDHIDAMIRLVERLLAAGHAYQVDGNVFFSVKSFPEYGRLAHLQPEEMRATARVEDDDYGKREARDFALWKAARPGEPSWSAAFGDGRPGWHLECSAMSMQFFGESFDLHLGGADLLFPHHENEIAQSEAATGRPFVRHWMHCQHLIVDGAKMSKSLGNFRTLEEMIGEGDDPVALRFLLASVHYRRQLNLTAAAIEQAHASVQRLRDTARRVGEARDAGNSGAGEPSASAAIEESLRRARAGFVDALHDDLNTAGALGHVFVLAREVNAALDTASLSGAVLNSVLQWFEDIDEVLAIFAEDSVTLSVTHAGRELRASGPPIEATLQQQVTERMVARAERDFGLADQLRQALADAGVEVEDTPDGARWKRRSPRAD